MKKNKFSLYTLLSLSLLFLLFGCQDSSQGEDESIRRLEANSKLLEVNGKIKTFPLTVVIADQLTGETFPQEIQNLCALSTDVCKTLPIAGILRLGPNNYYTYNYIADLQLPSGIEKNEAALTETTNEQVNQYLSTAKLSSYDSLLTPNHAEWNLRDLSLTYINNTADSIFFFSQIPFGQAGIQVGTKRYKVYTDITELRKRINELICTGHPTISVFYNFHTFQGSENISPGNKTADTAVAGAAAPAVNFPAKGTVAGDTCVGTTRFERLHDGKGGFILGILKEANSTACGFTFPTGRAGDTCISGSKFQRFYDGKGGFRVGSLIEKNSKDCGFVFPTGPAGDTCVAGSKYQRMHNGRGGFRVGSLLERNSTACGYTPPAPVVNRPAVVRPAKGTPAPGFTCYRGSKYAKVHDGKGGITRGSLIEENSSDCTVKTPVDNQCVRRSEPICEQDIGGNYTGRRIQNCYNRSGKVIKVIVLSKCDADCRCIGG